MQVTVFGNNAIVSGTDGVVTVGPVRYATAGATSTGQVSLPSSTSFQVPGLAATADRFEASFNPTEPSEGTEWVFHHGETVTKMSTSGAPALK